MTLQKALLSHAKSIKWLLASLENKGGRPEIFGVRVSRHEVVVVLKKSGVLHDPSFNTLRGYKPLGRPKKEILPEPSKVEVEPSPGPIHEEAVRA
jgi:hypothetical protein